MNKQYIKRDYFTFRDGPNSLNNCSMKTSIKKNVTNICCLECYVAGMLFNLNDKQILTTIPYTILYTYLQFEIVFLQDFYIIFIYTLN